MWYVISLVIANQPYSLGNVAFTNDVLLILANICSHEVAHAKSHRPIGFVPQKNQHLD